MIKNIKKYSKTKIVVGIITITTLWMLSGIFQSKTENDSAKISQEISISSISSIAKMQTKYLTFSATSFANNNIDLVAQVTGKVVKRFVNEGMKLKAGTQIIQIQNDALLERVEQMKDAVKSAKIKYESILELNKKNLSSKLDIEDAKKDLNTAEADLSSAQTDLDNTYIVAPFDGIVDSIFVKEGDLVTNVGAGQSTVGKFVNLKLIEARAYLSQKERNEIINSKEAIIIRDNQLLNAKITFIAASADSQTGTFLIRAVSENSGNIADGEAIQLKIKVGDFQVHTVPISALIVDKDGDLAVRTVNEAKKPQDYKINIIDENEKEVLIGGLPEKCEIVTAGQSYIS